MGSEFGVKRWCAVVAAAAMLGIAGCGGGDDDSNGAATGGSPAAKEPSTELAEGTFGAEAAADHEGGGEATVRLSGDWGPSLVPPTISVTPAYQIVQGLYDRLVTYDPEGELVPYLAESWEVTPKTVTFKLREGPTCSDGTPITPEVVANSIEFWVDPDTKSPWASFLGPGPITVEADEAGGTVTVKSGTAFNELVTVFANPYAAIVCPAGTEDGANQDQAYGSGPYTLESATHNQQAVLKRRADWDWGPLGATADVLPETLTFRIVVEDSTAANLVSTGEVDVSEVTGPDVDRLLEDDSLLRFRFLSTQPHMIQFNMEKPALQDQKVREALLTAIDREQYNTAELAGHGTLSPSIFGPEMDCFVDTGDLLPQPDPERARQLLEEAGYADENGVMTKDGQPLTIEILGAETQASGPEYISEALEAIGVQTDLRVVPYDQFGDGLHKGEFDMIMPVYSSGYPAPSDMALFLTGKKFEEGGSNYGRVDDAELDEIAEKAMAAPLEERCQYWEQFQKEWVSRHYGVPAGMAATHWFTHGFDLYSLGTALETWSVSRRAG
jgi:peptide/nickel transport system substrate-binding protein